MLKKINIGIFALILIEAAAFGICFTFNTVAQTKSLIEYQLLKSAGVKIPIREFNIKDGDTLEFDLYKKDISIKDYIWSWLWGKNFGYYMNGVDPDNVTIKCPYVGEKQKHRGSSIRKIEDGKYHVILVLSQSLITAIVENQCAISPRPRKAPNANSNKSGRGKTDGLLFPTIYNLTPVRLN
jgi:hypothetical protein